MNEPKSDSHYSVLSNPYYSTVLLLLLLLVLLRWAWLERRRSAVQLQLVPGPWRIGQWEAVESDTEDHADDYVALNWLSLSILCEPDILIWESAQDFTSQQWTIVDNNSSATSSFGSSHNRRRNGTTGEEWHLENNKQNKGQGEVGTYFTPCAHYLRVGQCNLNFIHPPADIIIDEDDKHWTQWGLVSVERIVDNR